MRADRLLAILLTLQAKGLVTASQLADDLEVSERTIYRDMEALSMAGIPVVAERGIHGGWRLIEGYRTNLAGLHAQEIQTLFLNQPLLADLGFETTAQTALLKVLATLPPQHRHQADLIRQRLHIDVSGWHRSKEDIHALPSLQEAVWNECQVQITYRRGEEQVERVVHPLGLVAKGSVWYLVGQVADDLRTYRVSRIESVTVLDQPCQRPPDFDLAAFWAESTTEFIAKLPCYAVVVRVAPEILPRLRYAGTFAKIQQVDPPAADGWSRVEVCFDLPEEAREFALGFGTQMEVLAPDELRQAVIQMAEAILDFYVGTKA